MEEESETLDKETSDDFETIMNEEENTLSQLPKDSFKHIFWRQQKEAIGKKNALRWHPLMIKWCLYLRHFSSKAYETLRNSGCIVLPSQRILCDYFGAMKAEAGFSNEVDHQLLGCHLYG